MRTLFTLTIIRLACFVIAGCQTPQERAMSQMEKQTRIQMELMKRMQKDMAEEQKAMKELASQTNTAEK
jgi:uncharacterized protein YcfL